MSQVSESAVADDFGHLVHRIPAAVLRPGSAAEVAGAVRRANEVGDRIAAQGRRHSVWGRSQVGGGVVVDMGDLRTVHSVHDDRVVVDAGATWREVLAATLPLGLTPPVLTDYLDLSVAGTLVVGGVGGTTYGYGVQADTGDQPPADDGDNGDRGGPQPAVFGVSDHRREEPPWFGRARSARGPVLGAIKGLRICERWTHQARRALADRTGAVAGERFADRGEPRRVLSTER